MLGGLTLSARTLGPTPDTIPPNSAGPDSNRFWSDLHESLRGWLRYGGTLRFRVHDRAVPLPSLLGSSEWAVELEVDPDEAEARIVPEAIVAEPHRVAPGARVWHFSHVRESALIGPGSSLGHGVYIDAGAIVGSDCKLQNGVNVYRGVVLGDRVFVGPGATFTNDRRPRAVGAWELVPTFVGEGASIGANATIVCGAHIGRFAMIGAGAVVTEPVPPHALMLGVPARQRGYVCRCGAPAQPRPDGTIVCRDGGDCPCQPPVAAAT